MADKCVSWVGILLLVLTLANKLCGATVNSKASEQLLKGNPFNILSFLSELKYPVQVKSLNETLTSCPNLWTHTEKEFSEKEETGVLGSVTKLQELCPDKENLTLVCNGAIWISGYVCTASQGDQRQLPAVRDLKNLTDVSGLCQALVGNVSLTQKLCDIVETSVKSSGAFNMLPLKEKLGKGCTMLSNGSQEHCNQYCGETKQPLCKIILQSLRTIVSLEEKKENLLADTGANADTDLPMVPTSKIALNPISSTDLPATKPPAVVHVTELVPQGPASQIKNGTLNSTMQTTNLSSIIPMKTNDEKAVLPLDSNAFTQPSNKIPMKSPSTVATDFDTSSATEATVTDEDFGLDEFGSADKPPVKSAEDPPSYEDGDDPIKEEKELNKDDVEVPMRTQNAVHTYGTSSEMDAEPINTHFLFYFIAFVVLSASGYLMFMRRKYLIALVLEGRLNSNRRRSNSFRDRPSSGSYRKLVNNLEEAITSNSVKNSNVIY